MNTRRAFLRGMAAGIPTLAVGLPALAQASPVGHQETGPVIEPVLLLEQHLSQHTTLGAPEARRAAMVITLLNERR